MESGQSIKAANLFSGSVCFKSFFRLEIRRKIYFAVWLVRNKWKFVPIPEFVTLITCLKGHKSLGLLYYCQLGHEGYGAGPIDRQTDRQLNLLSCLGTAKNVESKQTERCKNLQKKNWTNETPKKSFYEKKKQKIKVAGDKTKELEICTRKLSL